MYRLGFGAADVGGQGPGAVQADIEVTDPGIPPLALRLIVGHGGGQVAPYDGADVLLDGQPLDEAAYWRPGQQVAVGSTLLDLVPYQPPDAALHPAEDGAGLEFNRPPRLLPPESVTRFQLPHLPGRPERRPVPILMALVPVLLGVGMAYFLRQVYMLAIAVFSPVMLLGSYVSDRRHGRKSHARQQAEHEERKARVERDARDALRTERARRRHDCPDPATVLSIASGPRRRLWERRRTDPDYLVLRVGTADLPSAVELTDPAADEHRRRQCWRIADAPVTIPLAERSVAGVAGPGDVSRAIGLVGIAQRGRSLGIHLILATQRPAGAVSADIRANTNLRIALRMTDAAESADVIDAPDAARIARAVPGRGYVRLGHASLVPFRAGRIGGRRPGANRRGGAARPWVTPLAWATLGRPEPRRPAARQAGRR